MSAADSKLGERLGALAQELIQREARHQSDVDRARAKAVALHAQVRDAVFGFNAAVADSAPQLQVCIGDPRADDKHLHASQFDLERGRYRAIVTVKSKGEVTLVGPFKQGKAEGPCRSFAFSGAPENSDADFDDALGDFLERFLEDATTP